MDTAEFDLIKAAEPEMNYNQMNYLKEFLMQNKKKSDFSSFIKKQNKKKK